MKCQGKNYRQLSASGFNPIMQQPNIYHNYGPVFGNNSIISAPMLFDGGNYTVTNSKNSNNQLQIPSIESGLKKESKRNEREENKNRLANMLRISNGIGDGDMDC